MPKISVWSCSHGFLADLSPSLYSYHNLNLQVTHGCHFLHAITYVNALIFRLRHFPINSHDLAVKVNKLDVCVEDPLSKIWSLI